MRETQYKLYIFGTFVHFWKKTFFFVFSIFI